MQRWLTHLFIAGYVSALGFGLFSHAFSFLKGAHPAMYFVVWDMYCGWSAYENRLHIIGEGASGKYYELAPGPWGDFTPYASCGRQHYDTHAQFAYRLATNTIAHTRHEPISRIMVVEEAWPKKYNLPDALWKLQETGPKVPHSYYHLRAVYAPDGRCVQRANSFLEHQYELAVANNPRLRNDMRKGHTFFATNPADRAPLGIQQVGYESTAEMK